MIPELLGTKVTSLRVVNSHDEAILFQIDEVTAGGEYICPQGDSPNVSSASGYLDKHDEIVFLFEDADTGKLSLEAKNRIVGTKKQSRVTIKRGTETRTVFIVADDQLPLSQKNYLSYDAVKQYLSTPYYYAQFGKDRFHFTRAGCMDFSTGKFIDLTNELRVNIRFTGLWGLLSIHYTEEDIMCKVTRYKAGPVRLIRRGDFYLKLGLGFNGSRAVVYQICYPQLVNVPVRVNLPVQINRFFDEAFIEMTPVVRKNAIGFRFVAPGAGIDADLSEKATMDTLIRKVPEYRFSVTDGVKGFEWFTTMNAEKGLLDGSGYILRRPGKRNGEAECGFRLRVIGLPRGSYNIVNWVLFAGQSTDSTGRGQKPLGVPTEIVTSTGSFSNLLAAPSRY